MRKEQIKKKTDNKKGNKKKKEIKRKVVKKENKNQVYTTNKFLKSFKIDKIKINVQTLLTASFSFISLMIIFIIILIFSFITIMNNNEKEKRQMSEKIYKFNTYTQNEIMIDYNTRKINFIKKALYIWNKEKSTFPDELRLNLAAKIFDLQEETYISGYLFLALADVESNFNNDIIGADGEITYIQVMPLTWQAMTAGSYYPGCENDLIFIATCWFKYMKSLSLYFKEDNETFKIKSILAYNCGKQVIKSLKTMKDIHNFKIEIYNNKRFGNKPYDEKVLNKYVEYRDLKFEE
jgi:hypothetical protein